MILIKASVKYNIMEELSNKNNTIDNSLDSSVGRGSASRIDCIPALKTTVGGLLKDLTHEYVNIWLEYVDRLGASVCSTSCRSI